MTGPPDVGTDTAPEEEPDVPVWEDEYVDRVSDRIMFHYDLAKEFPVQGHEFDLYGQMRMESHKQFLHPSITYGHHHTYEHLFVDRVDSPDVDLSTYVDLGHDLADAWIEADEQHYSTDFTFAVVVPELSDAVREFVSDFSDRTLLKYGFYGHYEIHLLAVAPDDEEIISSQNADVTDAFTTWQTIEPDRGLVARLKERLLG